MQPTAHVHPAFAGAQPTWGLYSNVERRESGPAHLDATADNGADLAEDRLLAQVKDAAYRQPLDRPHSFFQATERAGSAWVKRDGTIGEALADATDYGNGPDMADVINVLLRIARKGDVDAEAMVDRLVATFAHQNHEVAA